LTTLHKYTSTTLAILPFKVNNGDVRLQNIFIGFVDDLITNFSKFVGLSVISSLSTQTITDISNQEEIEKLDADYLIFGSVRQLDQQIRISIQLTHAKNKKLVFGANHDISLDALLSTQDAIIEQIVSVLQDKINYNLLSHSYKKSSVELAAYENYLLGMNTITKGSSDYDKEARKYFEAALAINPNYSLAYTGIALSYFNFWSCLIWDRWDETMQGAHKYALKAVEIDPNDYLASGILGRNYVYMGEYDLAEHHLRKSLRMNSSDASNLLRVSFSLLYLGYAQESVNLYEKAIKINPFHKDHYYAYGSTYYLELGDFNKSIELSKKVSLEVWTDFPAWVAAAHFQLNNLDEMWSCWEVFLKLYKKEVHSGNTNITEAALEWLPILNPFRGSTYLTPLIDFIKKENEIPNKVDNVKSIAHINNLFTLNGGVWQLNYKDNEVIFKDAKGFHDIHKLLSSPNDSFHCLDLMGAGVDESHATETIDAKSKTAYMNRIKELQEDIQVAESMNQIETASKLKEEYETILEHLSNALGLSGKSRKVGSTIEKARSAVTWRIRNSIKKIKEVHPELGKHLSQSIKTGTHCTYQPELEIRWQL
jgi:TolB-like protein